MKRQNMLAGLRRRIGGYESRLRRLIYRDFFDNPFRVDPEAVRRDRYVLLAEEAAAADHSTFLRQLTDRFEHLPEKLWVDALALRTQIVIKDRQLVYQHGFLLYAALRDLIARDPEKSVTVLETGTARGFSAVCLAKALADVHAKGKVVTLDVLPHEHPMYWNCVLDAEGPSTRKEILQPYRDIVESYVLFIQGRTDVVLEQLAIPHVNFAFLDAGHDYTSLKRECDYVVARQRTGDVIVFDDYSPQIFPGVVKAADELVLEGKYEHQVFVVSEDRGYCWCRRK